MWSSSTQQPRVSRRRSRRRASGAGPAAAAGSGSSTTGRRPRRGRGGAGGRAASQARAAKLSQAQGSARAGFTRSESGGGVFATCDGAAIDDRAHFPLPVPAAGWSPLFLKAVATPEDPRRRLRRSGLPLLPLRLLQPPLRRLPLPQQMLPPLRGSRPTVGPMTTTTRGRPRTFSSNSTEAWAASGAARRGRAQPPRRRR